MLRASGGGEPPRRAHVPAGTAVAKAEGALKAAARKKGFKGRRADRYVYGALNNMGMKHGNVSTAKGLRRIMPPTHIPVRSSAARY